MDTRNAATAAADALGRAAAASLSQPPIPDYVRRVLDGPTAKALAKAPVCPRIPPHIREAFDSPIAKMLANAKPPVDGPAHPALAAHLPGDE